MTTLRRILQNWKNQCLRYLALLASKMPSPESLRQTWVHRWVGDGLFHHELWVPTRHSFAMGMAVGFFFGLLPLFGLQIATSLVFGFFVRAHLPTAALGTFISNPFTVPAIVVLQYGFGKKISSFFQLETKEFYIQGPQYLHHGIPFGIGAIVSAILLAVIGYGLVYLFWRHSKKPFDHPF